MLIKNGFYKWALIGILISFGMSVIFSVYIKNNNFFSFYEYSDEQGLEDFVFCNTAGVWLDKMNSCDHFYLEYLPNKTLDITSPFEIPNLDDQQIIQSYKSVRVWRKAYGKTPYPALIDLTNGKLSEELD